jgi:formamidopyrimidine-DNA glycosylase
MPELPEVEVVRRGVEDVITGARITSVTVLDSRSLKRHPGPPEDFVGRLTGAVVTAAVRRGKFLWFPLQGTCNAVVCHLGMSGQVLLGDEDSDFGSHLRVLLELTTRAGDSLQVGFVDQRIFGSLAIDELVPTNDGHPGGLGSDEAVVPLSVSHIARDPLDPHFDELAWSRRLRSKHTDIKRALLDQNLISGIGNIYADEALWATKRHYLHSTNRMTAADTRILLQEVRAVLRKALAEGGTSFDQQYVNVNGQSGYFSHSLEAYGRDGQPCSRCGSTIHREPFMNRSSHRCPRCQRVPRTR